MVSRDSNDHNFASYLFLKLFWIGMLIMPRLGDESFSHQHWLIVFHWSLSDSKSPQDSRTRLSNLVDLNNAVVLTVSTCSVFSKSSIPCTDHLVTLPRAAITIGIIVTFMFHGFFNSLASSSYLSFFSYSDNFNLWFSGTAHSLSLQVFRFFVDYSKFWSSGQD